MDDNAQNKFTDAKTLANGDWMELARFSFR